MRESDKKHIDRGRKFGLILIILTFTGVTMPKKARAEGGAQLPAQMVESLKKAILKNCPKAKINVEKDKFVAKNDTLLLTLHRKSKIEILPETYQVEGANSRGFILEIRAEPGGMPPISMLLPPQGGGVVTQQPYSSLFVDIIVSKDEKEHFNVHFEYGKSVDPALEKAIYSVLYPK